MKRITSIDEAIKYFANGTKETSETISGNKFTYIVPPNGFIKLEVTFATGLTFVYPNSYYADYLGILKNKRYSKHEVKSICLYYD